MRSQAAYHGVPLVGIPMYGDQPDNMAKAVHRGFGLLVPAHNLQVPLPAALSAMPTFSQIAYVFKAMASSTVLSAHVARAVHPAVWSPHAHLAYVEVPAPFTASAVLTTVFSCLRRPLHQHL